MRRTFSSPAAYHPSYSVLGRAIRSRVDDRLRGEALFIVVLAGLILILLAGHYLSWVFLEPLLADHPTWEGWFWGGQVITALAWAALGLVGVRPGVQVICTDDVIEVTQGSSTLKIPRSSLSNVDRISSTRYYRHYRRYAATRVFVSQCPDQVLLLRTETGPVIVALPKETQTALFDHLTDDVPPSDS